MSLLPGGSGIASYFSDALKPKNGGSQQLQPLGVVAQSPASGMSGFMDTLAQMQNAMKQDTINQNAMRQQEIQKASVDPFHIEAFTKALSESAPGSLQAKVQKNMLNASTIIRDRWNKAVSNGKTGIDAYWTTERELLDANQKALDQWKQQGFPLSGPVGYKNRWEISV